MRKTSASWRLIFAILVLPASAFASCRDAVLDLIYAPAISPKIIAKVQEYESELGSIGNKLSKLAAERNSRGKSSDISAEVTRPLLEWVREHHRTEWEKTIEVYDRSGRDFLSEGHKKIVWKFVAAFRQRLEFVLNSRELQYKDVMRILFEFEYATEYIHTISKAIDESHSAFIPDLVLKFWGNYLETGKIQYQEVYDPQKEPNSFFGMRHIEEALELGFVFVPARAHFGIDAYFEWNANTFGLGLFPNRGNEVHGKSEGTFLAFVHDLFHFVADTAASIQYRDGRTHSLDAVQELSREFETLKIQLVKLSKHTDRSRKVLKIVWYFMFHESYGANLTAFTTEDFLDAVIRFKSHISSKQDLTKPSTRTLLKQIYKDVNLSFEGPHQFVDDLIHLESVIRGH